MGIMANIPHEYRVAVRQWAGKGQQDGHQGGNVGSIGLWGVNGDYLGADHKHGHHLHFGEFRDVTVHTHGTNKRPDYIVVAAQDEDVICLAGFSVSYMGLAQPLLVLGDVLAGYGILWYQSRLKIGESDHVPLCIWIDGSGRASDERPRADSHDETHGTCNRPPAGSSMKLSDFAGSVVNNYTAIQRYNNPSLVCDHPARLKIWDDMGGHIRVPIFSEKPLQKLEYETDPYDLLDKEWALSEKLHRDIHDKRALEDKAAAKEAAAAKREKLLHGTLVKDERSAEHLCKSPISYGPDWYSYKEHHLCHMASKTLVPGCTTEVTDDCFDAEKHEIRPRVCAPGRKCARAVSVPKKTYEVVEDGRDPQSRPTI